MMQSNLVVPMSYHDRLADMTYCLLGIEVAGFPINPSLPQQFFI